MRTTARDAPLRDRFIAWQCQVRRKAVRADRGRPSAGMRPRVLSPEGDEIAPGITVVLMQRRPAAATDMFRNIVRKSFDPRERYEAGLKVLVADYFQDPRSFGDVTTALFSAESHAADALVGAGRCVLAFAQHTRRFLIPCAVRELGKAEPYYQATYWHNALFNPEPPAAARILAFHPHWIDATATDPNEVDLSADPSVG